MKKTLSVNLGGSVYHIDEDAYTVLMDYLQDVKRHLGDEASSEEVLNDIEQRINELFNQWMQGRREVITTSDVDKVIGILGRPEQYKDGESDSAGEPGSMGEKKEHSYARPDDRSAGPHRRLYRDPQNAVFGGVCAGLAIYLNVSVVLIRLLIFLLIWFGGTGLFAYFICWVIIPEARTSAQRLEMQGEDVTIDNIEKKVREEYEKVKGRVDGYVTSNRMQENMRTAGNSILEIVRVCFKVFFAFIAGVIGFAGFSALLALIIALIVFLTGGIHFITPWVGPFQPIQQVLMTPSSAIWMFIGMILVIGVPFIAIFKVLFRGVLNLKPSPRWEIWVGLIFWLIGLGLCLFSGLDALNQTGGGLWI